MAFIQSVILVFILCFISQGLFVFYGSRFQTYVLHLGLLEFLRYYLISTNYVFSGRLLNLQKFYCLQMVGSQRTTVTLRIRKSASE